MTRSSRCRRSRSSPRSPRRRSRLSISKRPKWYWSICRSQGSKKIMWTQSIRLTLGCVVLAAALAVTTVIAQTTVKLDSNSFGAIEARPIGPATTSGRIAAIDGVNSDPRILYVGSAGGGVWKSINAGTTFKPVFDKYTQSIGAITIDQSRPDTVWVGTGESWTRNSVSVGTGVY